MLEKLTLFLKKNASFDRLALDCISSYFYFAGAGVAGAGAVPCAGAAGVFTGASVLSMILESVSLKDPEKLKLESKINTIKTVAKVQVLLSKKSVVFCTPPNICVPLIVEDNPPPLGFCTMITMINRKQTIVIKTKKIENVLIT
jgi:hypothetical protein